MCVCVYRSGSETHLKQEFREHYERVKVRQRDMQR